MPPRPKTVYAVPVIETTHLLVFNYICRVCGQNIRVADPGHLRTLATGRIVDVKRCPNKRCPTAPYGVVMGMLEAGGPVNLKAMAMIEEFLAALRSEAQERGEVPLVDS